MNEYFAQGSHNTVSRLTISFIPKRSSISNVSTSQAILIFIEAQYTNTFKEENEQPSLQRKNVTAQDLSYLDAQYHGHCNQIHVVRPSVLLSLSITSKKNHVYFIRSL